MAIPRCKTCGKIKKGKEWIMEGFHLISAAEKLFGFSEDLCPQCANSFLHVGVEHTMENPVGQAGLG